MRPSCRSKSRLLRWGRLLFESHTRFVSLNHSRSSTEELLIFHIPMRLPGRLLFGGRMAPPPGRHCPDCAKFFTCAKKTLEDILLSGSKDVFSLLVVPLLCFPKVHFDDCRCTAIFSCLLSFASCLYSNCPAAFDWRFSGE